MASDLTLLCADQQSSDQAPERLRDDDGSDTPIWLEEAQDLSSSEVGSDLVWNPAPDDGLERFKQVGCLDGPAGDAVLCD